MKSIKTSFIAAMAFIGSVCGVHADKLTATERIAQAENMFSHPPSDNLDDALPEFSEQEKQSLNTMLDFRECLKQESNLEICSNGTGFDENHFLNLIESFSKKYPINWPLMLQDHIKNEYGGQLPADLQPPV